MSDPRYLTIMVVGAAVCGGVGTDRLAADGKSEPWQVFEWYVVEGLVRTYGEGNEIRGLPGVDKVRAARRNGLPISAGTYLKTPQVFGFHGVYRGLGESLELFDDAGLLPLGWELLEAWEKDQSLDGFHGTEGEIAGRRQSLVAAVNAGLEMGATDRSGGWSGWAFIGKHLAPGASGPRELEVLQRALYGPPGGRRHQVVDFLVSQEGQQAWRDCDGSERRFHELLRPSVDADVRMMLDAISAYEWFARLAQDAFDDCLYWLSSGYGRLSPDGLAEATAVQRVASEIADAYERASEALAHIDEAGRFANKFAGIADPADAASLAAVLLDHHYRNQAAKPPDGKNPWFDRFDDGSVAVRAAYRRDRGARDDDEYVHYYRTRPLHSFAAALGLVST